MFKFHFTLWKIIFCIIQNLKIQLTLKPHDLISGKRIYGSWGGNSKLDSDLLKFNKVISKSKISLDKIYQLVKFEDIKQLFKNKKKINKPKLF